MLVPQEVAKRVSAATAGADEPWNFWRPRRSRSKVAHKKTLEALPGAYKWFGQSAWAELAEATQVPRYLGCAG